MHKTSEEVALKKLFVPTEKLNMNFIFCLFYFVYFSPMPETWLVGT
jgi:hypothetical protein